MGNLATSLKRFVANKNTITILGVFAGVIVLWAFYNYRVKDATNPINVPYAKVYIPAATEITEDMIGFTEINSKLLKTSSIIQNKNALVGKYVTTGTSIPLGGLFYTSQVVEKDDLPHSIFENIEKGYTLFSLSVNLHTTYANSIYPGTRIDLYMKTVNDERKLMYGILIKSIEVLAVRDSKGKNVFDQNPPTTPAELLFAVDNSMYELLMKASYISSVDLVPVPRNKAYTEEAGETLLGVDELINYINAKSANISSSETINQNDVQSGTTVTE